MNEQQWQTIIDIFDYSSDKGHELKLFLALDNLEISTATHNGWFHWHSEQVASSSMT